jgi:hypothetical protein
MFIEGNKMRSNRFIAITSLLLTLIIVANQFTVPTVSSTTQNSGIRTNRLVLNQTDLIFTLNDTFSVFLLIENIGTEPLYDLNFNYSINKEYFSIVNSTNSTQTSNDWVYYEYSKISSGDMVSFNLTLQVITNQSVPSVTLEPMTLKYLISEFRLPETLETSSLKVKIVEPPKNDERIIKIFGIIELDSVIFVIIFALPILLGFLLSFIFGRRRFKA